MAWRLADDDELMRRVQDAEAAVAAGADPFIAAKLKGADDAGASGPWAPAANKLAAMAVRADCPATLAALFDKYNIMWSDSWPGCADGKNFLTLSALRGSALCMAVMISRGADVHALAAVNGTECSLLYLAASNGHLAVCRQLLDEGVDMNVRSKHSEHGYDRFRFTPLHAAAQENFLAVVTLLIQRGADTHIGDLLKQHPVHTACRN
jgi:hypothetical protein